MCLRSQHVSSLTCRALIEGRGHALLLDSRSELFARKRRRVRESVPVSKQTSVPVNERTPDTSGRFCVMRLASWSFLEPRSFHQLLARKSTMTGTGSSHESTLAVHLVDADGGITSMRSKRSDLMSDLLSKFEKHKKVDTGTFRYLMDGERMSYSNEKTVGDYALEYESDGVLQLNCFSEQVGGSDQNSVTRYVCKHVSKC